MVATWVRKRQSSLFPECALVTSKAFEKGQISRDRAASRLPGVVTHSLAFASACAIQGGNHAKSGSGGRYRLGHLLAVLSLRGAKVIQDNDTDQKSGSTIIGMRKTQLRRYTRQDITLSCTDGLLTHNTKSLNAHMDGLLCIASTWTTSKLPMRTILLIGMEEIDYRTCSY